MKKDVEGKTKWLYALGIIPFVTGCAPGPPLPPVFPGLIGFGVEWIVVGFLVWAGILLWKKYSPLMSSKRNHPTEAVDIINQRVRTLEEKVEELEKKQGHHRK